MQGEAQARLWVRSGSIQAERILPVLSAERVRPFEGQSIKAAT
jgi:hypothetical protein